MIGEEMSKFSIKGEIYVGKRKRNLDGPWRATIEEAIHALEAWMVKKGFEGNRIFRPFVAERVPKEIAPCGDSHGNWYREVPYDLSRLEGGR